jgi:hypothetical protein
LNYLPLQISPFPSNPVLQLQKYDPGLFVQFAKILHGWFGHSLMSKTANKINEKIQNREET